MNSEKKTVKENAHNLSKDIDHLGETVKEVKDEIIDQTKKKYQEAKSIVDEYSNEVIQSTINNPIKSLLIAGAIGFVLAAIIKK